MRGFPPVPEPWSRRRFLGACAALSTLGHGLPAALAGEPGPGELDVKELVLPGDRHLARRALVLSPRGRPGDTWPILVLLHGMGETDDERLGVRAWSDRYGLVTSDARLRSSPLRREPGNRYLSERRTLGINEELHRQPYRGFVLVCPVTPNVYAHPSTSFALDRYADWIARTLLPAVRANAPARADAASTVIDGCSLGGYVAIEVFLRKPELFGALGTLQPAIGDRQAALYAGLLRKAIDHVGPRSVHIESSIWDPTTKVHEAMSAELTRLGVPNQLDVLPGGHDQIFLREVGTLEMLLWHDRRMAR
jgi:predicted esterase